MQGDDVEGGDVEDDEVQGGDVEDDEVKDDDVVVDDDDDVKGEEKDDVENHDVEEAEDDDTEDADVEEEDRSPDHAAGFVRACAVDMHVHEWGTRDIRRATLYRNFHKKYCGPKWAQNADTHFVRACAVETHVKISQEPLYAEIYRVKCRRPEWASWSSIGLYTYRKDPSVWTHYLGNYQSRPLACRLAEHTTLSHTRTTLSYITFTHIDVLLRGRRGFCVGDFAWQACDLATSTLLLRDRRGTTFHLLLPGRSGSYGTGLSLAARLVHVGRPGRRANIDLLSLQARKVVRHYQVLNALHLEMLRATAASTFSASQLPKVVRDGLFLKTLFDISNFKSGPTPGMDLRQPNSPSWVFKKTHKPS